MRIGAGQPREHRRVRGQPDHVSGRDGAVELGHGEVLVDDAAAVERDHPHDLLDLERERHDDRAHPRGDLPRKADQRGRIGVDHLVVDRHPAVPRPDHARSSRSDARREGTHGALDVGDRVRLDVERRERLRVGPGGEPLPERRQRRDEHDGVLDEAPVLIHGAGAGVRRDDVEIEVLDPVASKGIDDCADERCSDPATARVGDDVEVGQAAEPGAGPAREREAHGTAVVLGEVSEPRGDDRADLTELRVRIVVDVGRRRHLRLEGAPEALERLRVLGRRRPDLHGADARHRRISPFS